MVAMIRGNFVKLILLLLLIPVFNTGCVEVENPVMTDENIKAFESQEIIDLIPYWHRPIKEWRNVHMDKFNSGEVTLSNCIVCHSDPETFCNRCHEYVGVKNIVIDKSQKEFLKLELSPSLRAPDEPPMKHYPLETWVFNHDDAIIFANVNINQCLGCHQQAQAFCNKCHKNVGVRKIK
ncbi:MAG: hypothetical protein L3V56_00805 [Candidatus Magnetoovum sp. WYHC-5]|nr:hypothetical protein [Candidatus Magnetoovum sp. WYHC-5]